MLLLRIVHRNTYKGKAAPKRLYKRRSSLVYINIIITKRISPYGIAHPEYEEEKFNILAINGKCVIFWRNYLVIHFQTDQNYLQKSSALSWRVNKSRNQIKIVVYKVRH